MSSYSVHRPSRSPLDAIRLFCLECCGSSVEFGPEYAEVRDCPCKNSCSLWPYRFSKNPKHAQATTARARIEGLSPDDDTESRPNDKDGELHGTRE